MANRIIAIPIAASLILSSGVSSAALHKSVAEALQPINTSQSAADDSTQQVAGVGLVWGHLWCFVTGQGTSYTEPSNQIVIELDAHGDAHKYLRHFEGGCG